jgi:hypothetical protein
VGRGRDIPWSRTRSLKGNGETIPQNKRCLIVLSVIRGEGGLIHFR